MKNGVIKKKIMFSVHMGDSIAHVLRTRLIAQHLLSKDFNLIYSVSAEALSYLDGYIDRKYIHTINLGYSYAQIPYQNIYDQYYHHAASEAMTIQMHKPDFLIGDTGLIAYAYNPEMPFIRILNRFYIEIGGNLDSPYTADEKLLIKTQCEELINRTRKKLGITETFRYEEFITPPVLINGASYFVEDIDRTYQFAGINMTLRHGEIISPDLKKCLVIFGTGLSYNRVKLVSEVLRELENFFEIIYVSYGTKISEEHLYKPKNSIMKPLFNDVPDNIGALICHGGWGTIHLGIELGIPVIAIPFQVEQYSNAYHMENLGIGINAGTYNKGNFKGLSEEVTINWYKFRNAVQNIENIRRRGVIENTLSTDTNLLNYYIDKFIESFR